MAAFFAAASGGCAGRHEAGDATAPNSTAPTTLTIHNYNWLDAVIYVYHDGELTRVGSVTAASSANFMLAPWVLGPTRNIRLAVHPIGSPQSLNTELIHVQPGQLIEWRLENVLEHSSFGVY